MELSLAFLHGLDMELLHLWSPVSLSMDWDENQVSQFIQGDKVTYFASCSMYETFWDLSLPSTARSRTSYQDWLPTQMSSVLATCWFFFWFEDSLPRPVSPVKQKAQSSILAKLNFFSFFAFTSQLKHYSNTTYALCYAFEAANHHSSSQVIHERADGSVV